MSEELPLVQPAESEAVVLPKSTVGRLGRVVMFCCVAAIAIDYAVVMPSLWLFLRELDPGIEEWVLGLAIGAFALSSFLLQYPLGVWLDRRSMREVLVAVLWIAMIGNLAYFLSTQVWMVILSRFVCGVGTSVYLITSVFILRTTTEAERSEQFAFMNAVMMVAMIVGPGLNYPLAMTPKVSLFSFLELNSLNIVGLVMSGIFSILLVLVHALFEEPPHEVESKQPLRTLLKVVKLDTLSLMIAQFVALLNQTCLEVIIPPVVVAFYSFGQLYTSIFYAGLTFYLLIAFVVTGQLSKCFSDRVMILFGWLCVGAGGVCLLFSQLFDAPNLQLWQLALGSGVFATSSAFFETSVPSLFSKLAARHQKENAASSQSLLITLQSLAILIGPFVASPILSLGVQWVFVGVLVIWVVSFVFFLVSFRYLVVVAEVEQVVEEEKSVNG